MEVLFDCQRLNRKTTRYVLYEVNAFEKSLRHNVILDKCDRKRVKAFAEFRIDK